MKSWFVTRKRQLLGFLLLMIVFPLGMALGIVVARPPADSADLLALAGAFGGAALTVIGAITILEWERRAQFDHRRQIVHALLEEILKFVGRVRDPKVGEKADIPFGQAVMVDELAAAIERAKAARTDFPPMNIGMVKAYSTIGMIELDREAIDAELTPAKFYGGPTDLNRFLVMVEARAQQAISELRIEDMPVTGNFE